MLYYIDDFVCWYTSEELGKGFWDTLLKILHMNFLGYPHWFISISISQLNYHCISVDQDRYATYVVAKFLYTTTIKKSKFHKTTLPHDMIFTKENGSTSDENV